MRFVVGAPKSDILMANLCTVCMRRTCWNNGKFSITEGAGCSSSHQIPFAAQIKQMSSARCASAFPILTALESGLPRGRDALLCVDPLDLGGSSM